MLAVIHDGRAVLQAKGSNGRQHQQAAQGDVAQCVMLLYASQA
jgi:hypothetical protein